MVRNLVGRRMYVEDSPYFPTQPGKAYRFCLAVQDMGDQNCVDTCQLSHEHVLYKHDVQDENHMLRYDSSAPDGPI